MPKSLQQKARLLSGGQQRALCIAIAMCGKPEVILMDEPTSRLDVSTKDAVMNMIQAKKEGCTIVYVTHEMDEAELLGDRVAVISRGVVHSSGSSQFLKESNVNACRLILEKKKDFDTSTVVAFIKDILPRAKVQLKYF